MIRCKSTMLANRLDSDFEMLFLANKRDLDRYLFFRTSIANALPPSSALKASLGDCE